jgi:hypothetical protein
MVTLIDAHGDHGRRLMEGEVDGTAGFFLTLLYFLPLSSGVTTSTKRV